MHHINGINTDNSLENLKLLCPSCHALTENYRAKNIRNLSARLETAGVEPLKFGETLSVMIGNPEPSLPAKAGAEGVET
ncbi:HNH endonuclease signature motif containing protein [Spirosoma luteolum]